ncbi:MAG: hypothetical protein KGN84_19220, partial [Acidobacteriota bacterium]|nr:hypothetical protein [Acidobacteriota bacterium]
MANATILTAIAISSAAAAVAGTAPSLEYRHVATYGSREGIHTPEALNRRPAKTAFGEGDFPWGIGVPNGVCTDLKGRLWITDSGVSAIHIFDRANNGYRQIRRAGDLTLRQPSGIVSDAAGRVYVTDAATGEVFVFDPDGVFDRSLIPRRAGRLL